MNNLGSPRNLKYAVIVLLALNVATIGTIVYHLQQAKKQTVQPVENQTGKNAAYSGRYFRDRLQLSTEQMDAFRKVNSHFRQQARTINQELAQNRQLMLNEMQQQAPDTVKLEAYSGAIGNAHKLLKEETYRFYLGLKSFCDSNQQMELNRIFQEFFINENNPVSNGNGNPQRRYRKGNNTEE